MKPESPWKYSQNMLHVINKIIHFLCVIQSFPWVLLSMCQMWNQPWPSSSHHHHHHHHTAFTRKVLVKSVCFYYIKRIWKILTHHLQLSWSWFWRANVSGGPRIHQRRPIWRISSVRQYRCGGGIFWMTGHLRLPKAVDACFIRFSNITLHRVLGYC